jgi:hypothetical protein
MLATGGNWAANKANLIPTAFAEQNSSMVNKAGETQLFGAGTAARFAANAKIAAGASTAAMSGFMTHAAFRGGPSKQAFFSGGREVLGGMTQFNRMQVLTDPNLTGFQAMSRAASISSIRTGVSAADDMLRVAATSEGVFSQRLLGYQARAVGGRATATAWEARKAGAGNVTKGYSKAGRHLGRAGLDVTQGGLTRAGIKVGSVKAITGASGIGSKIAAAGIVGMRGATFASKFFHPIGWAMLTYDLGNLAGEGFKSAVSIAGDGAQSIQGSINKPIFGMGYKDTQFAATSRARGVFAIQNSRLNARSTLGSEGGMMAAHFG